MSPTFATFLFEVANFLVLAGALGWFLFKPVRESLDARREQEESLHREAAAKLAEADRIRTDIEKERQNLHDELAALRARELEAAQRRAEERLSQAQVEIQRQREQLRHEAARISESERDRLADACALAAGEAVGKLLDEIGGDDLETALVNSVCRELRALPQEIAGSVKVETARALRPEHRVAIEQALGGAAKQAEFFPEPALGIGLRVSTDQGLIEASGAGLARFARHALTSEMRRGNNHFEPVRSADDG